MRDFKIYFSLATVLLVVYLVAQFNKPSPANWNPTLYCNDKVSFGTYIAFHELKQLFPGANVVKTNSSIYQALNDSSDARGSYIIIAKHIELNKADFKALVKYINAGNSVFMSSFEFAGVLADTLHINTMYELTKKNATLNFTNPQLIKPADYSFTKDISNQYFSDFNTEKATVLGKNNNGRNTFISFKFGKGTLYLCTNPLVFSNFGILNSNGADYAAKALSYLPATQIVYWDEYQNGDIPEDQSQMRVFLSYPALQWAYYLGLAGMLIFILFEIKRRQRIIPVIEPLSNSTLDFVNVVGQVYYEKRDNSNIAHKKILYFFTHLRDTFQLKTTTLYTEFIERLALKTGIEQKFAVELISYIRYVSAQNNVNDRDLIELNKLIEKFYKQSR